MDRDFCKRCASRKGGGYRFHLQADADGAIQTHVHCRLLHLGRSYRLLDQEGRWNGAVASQATNIYRLCKAWILRERERECLRLRMFVWGFQSWVNGRLSILGIMKTCARSLRPTGIPWWCSDIFRAFLRTSQTTAVSLWVVCWHHFAFKLSCLGADFSLQYVLSCFLCYS